jgi:hypothetical protein
MQRPRIITILAVLAAIGGVFGILAGIGLMGLGAVSGVVGAGFLVGGLAIFWGLLTLVLSVAELAFAYGAWGLKPWAWMLGIVLQGVSIFMALINWVGGGSDFFSFLFNAVISGVIIYYLLTPEVKRAFGKA